MPKTNTISANTIINNNTESSIAILNKYATLNKIAVDTRHTVTKTENVSLYNSYKNATVKNIQPPSKKGGAIATFVDITVIS